MKILIADDHELFRDGLQIQLEQIDSDATIFQAGNFSSAIEVAREEKDIDIVIVDLDMPDMNWEKGISQVKEQTDEKTRFVVVSASENFNDIKETLNIGVSGYIPKRSDTKVLRNALRLIMDGGKYLPPAMLEYNMDPAAHEEQNNKSKRSSELPNGKSLTPRQAEVLNYLSQGFQINKSLMK